MKTWHTNYTHPEEGISLESLLNTLDEGGHIIFNTHYVGDDYGNNRQYCIVSYTEE